MNARRTNAMTHIQRHILQLLPSALVFCNSPNPEMTNGQSKTQVSDIEMHM
jgi:hypothetical protein